MTAMAAGVRRCLECTTLVPRGQSRCAVHRIQRIAGRTNQRRRTELVIGRRCARCGAPATDLDHVRSLARGGAEGVRSNLQPLCADCHKRKTATEGRGG